MEVELSFLAQTKGRRERERKRKGKEKGKGEREGRADKISNKLAGDVACLGGSMVEHQPRLLGSRVRLGRCDFFRFCQSFTSSFPFSFPFPSDLSFALKKRYLTFIP